MDEENKEQKVLSLSEIRRIANRMMLSTYMNMSIHEIGSALYALLALVDSAKEIAEQTNCVCPFCGSGYDDETREACLYIQMGGSHARCE